jgi:Ser/Thr protein kinase RdoA (MazF antagonist)
MIPLSEIPAIFRNYPENCQPKRIEPLGMAGGMSGALFWRLTSLRGTLVLRCWPTEHPSPERLRFIHAVLAHAIGRGITFLPLPIRTTAGESFVHQAGHLWELTPWMPGTANYEHSPSLEKLRAAMTALAQFHVALADFSLGRQAESLSVTHPPAIQRRLICLKQLAAGGIDELSRAINDATWPQLAPLARQFVAILPRAVPRAIPQLEPLVNVRLALQPCVRDIWHDHVLFTGDKVTGIIDFGAVDIDTPATDIARLLGSLMGDDSAAWQTGLAAYSETRRLSENERVAAKALDISGTILAGCNWIRWVYIDGRHFESQKRVVNRFSRLMDKLRR